MELVSVVDRTMIRENKPALVDGQSFLVGRNGESFVLPGAVDHMAGIVAGVASEAEGIMGRDVFRIGGKQIHVVPFGSLSPEIFRDAFGGRVRWSLLIDSSGGDRDVLPLYRDAREYLERNGGVVESYVAGEAVGPAAELFAIGSQRFVTNDAVVTGMFPSDSRLESSFGRSAVDFANDQYWLRMRRFLLDNSVEGMRSLMRARLEQVAHDEENPSNSVTFTGDDLFDFGIVEADPAGSVSKLMEQFQQRTGIVCKKLADGHPIRNFFKRADARSVASRRASIRLVSKNGKRVSR